MALLKVLLLQGLGASMNSHVSLQKRIIGGHDCDDKEHLYYVRLMSYNGTHTSVCGGSLIHPEWILTAAHCWKSDQGWTNVAQLGVHPRTAQQEDQIIQHNPVIYVDQWHQEHDIMLLKLQRPVRNIHPARLPRCSNRLRIGSTVQLAGEGGMITGPNNQRILDPPVSLHLQCVNMKVVAVSYYLQTRGHLFSVAAPNKDLCFGDSGGAVVFNKKIYGVISGVGAVAHNLPVFSIDVCQYMGWIGTTIRLK